MMAAAKKKSRVRLRSLNRRVTKQPLPLLFSMGREEGAYGDMAACRRVRLRSLNRRVTKQPLPPA